MKIEDVTCTAKELGEVLGGITARRVRQLTEEGLFERAARGRYPLAACVAAFVSAVETRSEPDDLRQERVGLMRAQRRKIELQNTHAEATTAQLDVQAQIVDAVAFFYFMRLRPIGGWLHAELGNSYPKLSGDDARIIARTVEGWFVGTHGEAEEEVAKILDQARREGTLIKDRHEIVRLAGRQGRGIADGEEDDTESG